MSHLHTHTWIAVTSLTHLLIVGTAFLVDEPSGILTSTKFGFWTEEACFRDYPIVDVGATRVSNVRMPLAVDATWVQIFARMIEETICLSDAFVISELRRIGYIRCCI